MNDYRITAKQRILHTAENDGDWQGVAAAHNVPYKTAWHWVNAAKETQSWVAQSSANWGGSRRRKITPAMVAYLEARISENCRLTLREQEDARRPSVHAQAAAPRAQHHEQP